jgi:hypothetical protein
VDWSNVIWTDECAFNVGASPGRVFVTRAAHEEYEATCLVPRFKKLDTIHVWGSFCGKKKGPLIVWEKKLWGNMTSLSYCDHIIPQLEDFWYERSGACGSYIYIQQDNASSHTAARTQKTLHERGLWNYLLPWPAASPDLNLIEGVWRLMKARISTRVPRPQTNEVMRGAIREEWNRISELDLEALISGMATRVHTVLERNGGHTRF